FTSRVGCLACQSGDIATRSRQAWNDSGADRIAGRCEHDGNCRCRLLCRERGWGVVRENERDLTLDEFGDDFAEPLGVSVARAIVDDDIAALGRSKLSQPIEKCGGPLALPRRTAGAQQSYVRHG